MAKKRTQPYGYQIACGKVTISPQEAETIRRIYRQYSAGLSLKRIAEELTESGVRYMPEKPTWNKNMIARILQNKSYVGENLYPVIIEVAEQQSAELAQKPYTHTESQDIKVLKPLLVCAHCNEPKQSVWRCINRLDYGTQYCTDSVTVDEESLHIAIVQAINATRAARREMIPFLTLHLERTLQEGAKGTVDVQEIENRIHEIKAKTMELVAQSIANNTVGENEGRLRAMSDEVKALSDMLEKYRLSCDAKGTTNSRMAQITEILENEPEHSDTYNDILVRQLIDTIKVMGEDRLSIIFKCGLRYEQTIHLKVRKINRTA